MEEFIATGRISSDDFKEPRPNLCTERLFQIYINNTNRENLENIDCLVDEIMLADEELLSGVFAEQKLPELIGKKILDTVKEQKQFIISLPSNWQDNSSQKLAVEFIKDFQSQITEYLFLKDKDIATKVDFLVDASQQLFQHTNPNFNESCLTIFNKQDLLNEHQITQVYSILSLVDYSNRAEQADTDSHSFEKNNNQADFKEILNALKNNSTNVPKNYKVGFFTPTSLHPAQTLIKPTTSNENAPAQEIKGPN